MSKNKEIKRTLIMKYGKKCFIEELGIRSKEEIELDKKRYTSKKQRAIMDELTYHHIVEKCKNGKATEENGAILRNINHIWFNRQPKERQAELNKLFQEYKKSFKLNVAELTTEGIKQVQEIELPEITEDCIEIELEPTTEEDIKRYEEHKRKRNERTYRKFGVEYKR